MFQIHLPTNYLQGLQDETNIELESSIDIKSLEAAIVEHRIANPLTTEPEASSVSRWVNL